MPHPRQLSRPEQERVIRWCSRETQCLLRLRRLHAPIREYSSGTNNYCLCHFTHLLLRHRSSGTCAWRITYKPTEFNISYRGRHFFFFFFAFQFNFLLLFFPFYKTTVSQNQPYCEFYQYAGDIRQRSHSLPEQEPSLVTVLRTWGDSWIRNKAQSVSPKFSSGGSLKTARSINWNGPCANANYARALRKYIIYYWLSLPNRPAIPKDV